jgi:hypothetical protein
MPFGMLDTTYIDFPPGVDVAYLRGLTTRAGVQFPRLLREIDSRLGALNNGLDELVAALMGVTTDEWADTSAPTPFEVDERGEYTVARPQFVEGSAHMLPIRHFDVSLGFTEDGLEEMSLDRILLNVESLVGGFRKIYRVRALQRLFSALEVRVDTKTVVTSPGYAGSGTGDNVFTTPYPTGAALPGGYSHYYAVGAGTLEATLLAARDRLAKWHAGPFDLITNATQLALIQAINPGDPVDGFVSAGSLLVRPPEGDAVAQVNPAMYVGVLFGNVRVRMALDDLTSAHIAMFKSYGSLNRRNPLVWRWDPLKGRAATLRYRAIYPLALATVKQSFGIGVGNRVGAVLIENGAAPYSEPTFA